MRAGTVTTDLNVDGRETYAYLVGARPNFMKMAPVIRAARRLRPDAKHVLIHTGQHYDNLMSHVFFTRLALPEPDFYLGVGSGSHAEQTGAALVGVERALHAVRASVLVVPGDVNSTAAGALAASKVGVPVVHLEAGLRSRDRSMPEEINRIVTDHLSSLCLVHSDDAVRNLLGEGINPGNVRFVGNTMIDSVVEHLDEARRCSVMEDMGLHPGRYVLVTLHRPSLVDGAALRPVVEALEAIATDMPVVFPAHPRTAAKMAQQRLGGRLRITPPLPYVEFLRLENDACAVITDSGGVQEETTFLGVPCLTLRDNTERPVTVTDGTNQVIGQNPQPLRNVWRLLRQTPRRSGPPKLWDGNAGSRAAAEVIALVESEDPA